MRPCMLMSEQLNRTEHQDMSAWWALVRQTWLSTLSTTRCRDLRYEWQPCWKLRMNCAWEYHPRADQAQLSSHILQWPCCLAKWCVPEGLPSLYSSDTCVCTVYCTAVFRVRWSSTFPSLSSYYSYVTPSQLCHQGWVVSAFDCMSVSSNCPMVREHADKDRLRSSLWSVCLLWPSWCDRAREC